MYCWTRSELNIVCANSGVMLLVLTITTTSVVAGVKEALRMPVVWVVQGWASDH
jgi:hypothetical protein